MHHHQAPPCRSVFARKKAAPHARTRPQLAAAFKARPSEASNFAAALMRIMKSSRTRAAPRLVNRERASAAGARAACRDSRRRLRKIRRAILPPPRRQLSSAYVVHFYSRPFADSFDPAARGAISTAAIIRLAYKSRSSDGARSRYRKLYPSAAARRESSGIRRSWSLAKAIFARCSR